MYIDVNFTIFCDSFVRADRNTHFSHQGKRVLFEYLEQYEEDTGEKIELDIIALCCEYTEYDDLEELKQQYPDIETIEDLKDQTTVIDIDGTSFIIANF